MTALIPYDLNRCQKITIIYQGPFVLGGMAREERCKHKPTVVLFEAKPDKDGQQGSMSLCDECLAIFKNTPGQPKVVIKKIITRTIKIREVEK